MSGKTTHIKITLAWLDALNIIARTYNSWRGMIERCTNTNARSYRRYGARGIRVCIRWLKSFDNFVSDMGLRPSKRHSIERRDNNADYRPDNCYWATPDQQANNTSINRRVAWRGETKTVAQWAKGAPVCYRILVDRLDNGWTMQRAMTTPRRAAARVRLITIDERSMSFSAWWRCSTTGWCLAQAYNMIFKRGADPREVFFGKAAAQATADGGSSGNHVAAPPFEPSAVASAAGKGSP